MRKCYKCGAWIDFVETQAGRHMPVEPRPVIIRTDRGTENFITRSGKMVHGERALPRAEGFGLIAAYVPHWASCRTERTRRAAFPVAGALVGGEVKV